MASTISAGTTAGTAIAIAGDTTGNLAFTTQAGTYTQTLPNATGTVMVSGNMPTFRARPSSSTQSISNNTWTKVTFGTEDWDTNNNFASSTFTPTVAGYYLINGSAYLTNGSGNITQARCNIYKNGSTEVYGQFSQFNATGSNNTDNIATISGLVYCNGSTDYIELYAYIGGSSVSPQIAGSTNYTMFSGILIRAA